MIIVKRDGSEAEFNISKIETAINKANREVPEEKKLSSEIIHTIAAEIEKDVKKENRILNVEDIQDLVQMKVIKYGGIEVAIKYITYRYKRALIRKANTTDESILALINESNEEMKQENANKNPVLASTQRDYMAGEVSRDITTRLLLPEDIKEAHKAGIIHFHDSDYFANHIHNCFTGGTRFITDKGIRQFRDFNDGDSVYVKDMNGNLRLATVRKYGKQRMNEVMLKGGRMDHKVICTPNHRWILADGTVTTNLQVGDKLIGIKDSTSYTIDDIEDANAFCIGFVIGNGSDCSNDATKVKLCNDKIRYADYFKLAGYSEQKFEGNDRIFYRAKAFKQDFLNGKGWRFMTVKQKALMFKGYYAADGTTNANKISTTDERMCALIEETSGIAGYYISSMAKEIRDTEYKKDSVLFSYHFITSTRNNWLWTVKEIKEGYNRQDVDAWCVEEPVTHSFTLDKGMVTGNCDLVNLEDMLENGTVISGTKIEKPRSFSTACNIATQIIAQVACNQYGFPI